MTQLAGIDVSNYQGPAFNWESYRGKVQFAGIKVSEGTTFADPDAQRNIAGARSIGAVVIGYHFLDAGSAGLAQANWFLTCCKNAGMERGDVLAMDAEVPGVWTAAAGFAAAIHDHFGCWPLAYTDISLSQSAPPSVANCPLWLANPDNTPPVSIGPWKFISAEQTGQRGVDTDVFYGDAAQLKALAIPVAAPVPPPPPAPPQPSPTVTQARTLLAQIQADVAQLAKLIG